MMETGGVINFIGRARKLVITVFCKYNYTGENFASPIVNKS
jgi:hypothetical protein